MAGQSRCEALSLHPSHYGAVLGHLRDYGPVLAVEIAVIAATLLTYRIAAVRFGATIFAEYLVARRVVALLDPLVRLGLQIGVPRYLASSSTPNERRSYYGSALILLAVTTTPVAASLFVFRGFFGQAIFGGSSHGNTIAALSVILVGVALSNAAHAYFRGTLMIGTANLFSVVNLVFVPVLAVSLARGLDMILLIWGGLWVSTGAAAVAYTGVGAIRQAKGTTVRALLGYSVPRVPADLMLMSLLAFPAIIAAHSHGIESAGAVAFSASVLTMVGAFFSPISLFLLPKSVRMIGTGQHSQLRQHIRVIVGVVIVGSGCALVAGEFLAEAGIRLLLGNDYVGVVPVLRIALIGVVPYSSFMVLRGLIDAVHHRPVNTVNLAISLVVFASAAFALQGFGPAGLITAVVVAFATLGGRSLVEVQRIIRSAPFDSLARDLPRHARTHEDITA